MHFRKTLMRAAVPLAGITAALAMAGTALAITPPVHEVANGTAGYEALSGAAFRSVSTIMTTDPQFTNIGGVGSGGAGTQLCDPNSGFAAQEGETTNGTTATVEYKTGIIPGAAKNKCEGDGVLPGPSVLNANLTGLSIGDIVFLWTHFYNVRVHVHVKVGKHWVWVWRWQGRAVFQAYDLSTGEGPYTAFVHTQADWAMDSAGAGMQQDTTLTSVCAPLVPEVGYPDGGESGACNAVASFADAQVNSPSIFALTGSPLGLAPGAVLQQVVTTVGGLAANPATVAPNNSLTGGENFTDYAGNAV